jgi:hypothetical protein
MQVRRSRGSSRLQRFSCTASAAADAVEIPIDDLDKVAREDDVALAGALIHDGL